MMRWPHRDWDNGAAVSRRSGRRPKIHFRDLLMEAERIKEFAAEFDPQPFHIDESAWRVSWRLTGMRRRSLSHRISSLILNASIAGSKGLATYSVYSATKAAVRSFARTWTTDLMDRRIRVNTVSPSSIDTPAARDL